MAAETGASCRTVDSLGRYYCGNWHTGFIDYVLEVALRIFYRESPCVVDPVVIGEGQVLKGRCGRPPVQFLMTGHTVNVRELRFAHGLIGGKTGTGMTAVTCYVPRGLHRSTVGVESKLAFSGITGDIRHIRGRTRPLVMDRAEHGYGLLPVTGQAGGGSCVGGYRAVLYW